MPDQYHLLEVGDKETRKEFLLLPVRLYREDKNWIRPLDHDIEKVFDPGKNKFFRSGEAIRWILRNSQGLTVGRVSAFYERTMALKNDQPTGGMGYFECINDQEAAFILFDACREWLKEKNMEAMDGPINFGDRNAFWGLLVDGFVPQNYCVPYNFPYYKDLFEAYGFRNYFNQYTYHASLAKEELSEQVREKAARIARNPGYRFEHIRGKNLEICFEQFRIMYNKSWAIFPGIKELSQAHGRAMMKSIRPIMDRRLMWFGYYDDEPIAFLIAVPEINQVVKRLNGKMDLAGKIKFLYHLKLKKSVTKILGFIFAVIPEHQGKGIESALIASFSRLVHAPGFPYREMELNWIAEFNPAMIRLVEQTGCRRVKTHATFRYLFDRKKEFTRAKNLS